MIYVWKCWRTLPVCASACVGSSLHTRLELMRTQLCSCVCRSILEALCMWILAYICRVLSAYMGLDSRIGDTWQSPHFVHFHFFFHCFTSICNPNTPFCHFCTWTSPHPSFYLYSHIKSIIFHHFHLNRESIVIFFFCSPHPLMLVREALTRWWSGTTSLFPETRAYIREASFEPILNLLLERSIGATLVQCLIERWWDTTHTFHIVE